MSVWKHTDQIEEKEFKLLDMSFQQPLLHGAVIFCMGTNRAQPQMVSTQLLKNDRRFKDNVGVMDICRQVLLHYHAVKHGVDTSAFHALRDVDEKWIHLQCKRLQQEQQCAL
jgi:hypothetical protein